MVNISVVMPTYNTSVPILKEAVESILAQTFRDFEFIIIDDCSTDDDTCSYLQSLSDERIRIIRNPFNLGVTKSLNIGLSAARGKYIARMDSDDIALPMRFEKQFAFMEDHPDVIMCGTNVEFFGDRSLVTHGRITDMEEYRIKLLYFSPGPMHPTVFFNRELLRKYNVSYDETLQYAQDYGIYSDISKCGRMYVLEDVLLRYRFHSSQVSKVHREKQNACSMLVQEKILKELLGEFTKEELIRHNRYSSRDCKIDKGMIEWYRHLIEVNDRVGLYDRKKFKRCTYDVAVRRKIYASFDQNMSYIDKIALFFRYLPFPYSVKGAAGKIFNNAIRTIRNDFD